MNGTKKHKRGMPYREAVNHSSRSRADGVTSTGGGTAARCRAASGVDANHLPADTVAHDRGAGRKIR